MNRFHAKKPESKKPELKKTMPKTATAFDTPSTGTAQPPDRTKSGDGMTSIDDIVKQRQAEDNQREEEIDDTE